ncbi:alpha/beta fold hydrolase [Xanthomonas campestris pv. phormiicola]|nr:alpha/beta fold hydrolase [Xanthomonas campestris pv. phormiicola]UYC15167.1 alpha/beta fold hydrolase [Xanthomonas campestris pv. phormiicola]
MLASLLFPAAALAASPQQAANTLLDRLQAGDYAAATADFDARMHTALTPQKLAAVWTSLQRQLGPLQERGHSEQHTEGATTLVLVPLQYAKGELQARVGVNADGRISSLLIVPAASAATAAAPDANAAYIEQAATVGDLPGTLTLPKGTGPFPAVVLVHGSGPHDRDETIGPNKPFLDLAHGLAELGIAVLRYDKRTFARPESMAGAHLSVDAETTDDAVAAIASLAGNHSIDAHHIYLFGHSQGALLAPRIAARSHRVAGIVLLAAPARPFLDLLLEQTRTLGKQQSTIDQIQAEVRRIREPPPAGAAAGETVRLLGIPVPAAYARELDRIDPVAELRTLGPMPVLWLQGERDFQVTALDWQRWQQALGEDSRATLHRYAQLNHLGIAGSGAPNPAEYAQPGHVDAQLIADTAQWIRAQP